MGSKGFQEANPWPDLLDASRATWADDIAAGAIRTSSAHIARVAGAIYSAPSTTAERGQNWTYLTPVRAGARGQYRRIKP